MIIFKILGIASIVLGAILCIINSIREADNSEKLSGPALIFLGVFINLIFK